MTTNSDMISVIVPVFNEEKTVLKVLSKLNELKQSGFNCEIIVIDDGSTDNTRKILTENNKFINKLFFNDTNKGKGFSVKKGFKMQKEAILFFKMRISNMIREISLNFLKLLMSLILT